MAEEKKETWLNWLALTTVIFAVCATLSTFKGGGYSTRSVLSQTRASDQWAFYQAKSIKGYLYEVQREKLELERDAGRGSARPEVLAAYDATIARAAYQSGRFFMSAAIDESRIVICSQITAMPKADWCRLASSRVCSKPFAVAAISSFSLS